ncbi:MAG: sigma 54-interacting transcriptional regulator [Clostridia bacterium]|jgi:propionate catabolism regulator PrpR|nr:sigma 54-interacting transcriptional regulator [Clostridia bacterium]MDH7573251.1 sigma 54-interacting transcriptional regulator [Clostridia bacterium]
MDTHIALISTYPEMTRLAQEVAEELGEPILIREEVLGEAQRIAREIEKNGVEVIISRGATGAQIRRVVSIPVINIEIGSFELFQALWKGKQLGRKIAYVGYFKSDRNFDFGLLQRMLGIEVNTFFYRTEDELAEQIVQARHEGVDTVVCTGICIVQMAEAQGMRGVLVQSSRNSLVRAVHRAKELIMVRRREMARAELFQTILDSASEGILAVDQQGRVSLCNPVAAQLLGLDPREVLGQPVAEVAATNPSLAQVYGDASAVNGELCRFGDLSIVVNRVPMTLGEENIGLVLTLQDVTRIIQLEAKIRRELYHKGLVTRFNFRDIIGRSEALKEAVEKAKRYALTDSTVLLYGETGTGKELFAQSIHAHSRRKNGPFVAVNCAALPENLLESELFGYEEGAFTGARKGGKPGLFELAHTGTIFLDEIGEMPSPLQARLLRVLQEKEVMRLGGSRVIPVNVRVIAATNKNLRQAVQDGAFRADLFFRLNILSLKIPSLRERKEDIPLLVEHFIRRYSQEHRLLVRRPEEILIKRLESYEWPGNVRELENFIERYCVLAAGAEDADQVFEELFEELVRKSPSEVPSALSDEEGSRLVIRLGTLEDMEKQILRLAHSRWGVNRTELAERLGISRTTLWKKLKELGEA